MTQVSNYRANRDHFAEDTWRGLRFMLLGLLLIWGLYAAGNAGFRYLYNDVQSVVVEDHLVGENPKVTIYRVIRSDFMADFTVTVRNADTEAYVCQSDTKKPLYYRKSANKTQPLVLPLADWMARPEDYDDCQKDSRFGEGRFYIETTHKVNMFYLIPVSRTVTSAVFTRNATP
jgi:hypothetical protein